MDTRGTESDASIITSLRNSNIPSSQQQSQPSWQQPWPGERVSAVCNLREQIILYLSRNSGLLGWGSFLRHTNRLASLGSRRSLLRSPLCARVGRSALLGRRDSGLRDGWEDPWSRVA